MQGELDMSGKVVVVTGGTRGIGRGIARRFLEAGADVAVCGRNPPAEPLAVGERRALFLAGDIRKTEAIEEIVARAVEVYGHIDVLVNNAGGSPPADAATASPRFSAAIVQLNLLAPLHFAQRVNALMQRGPKGGAIINIASISGLRPSPGTAAYGAAKAGLLSLTQSLAIEWAPKVRVNAVSPGLIQTEQSALHYGDEDALARVAATVPLGELGLPEDVAAACLFLASPLARYMTGANLVLHGGGERPRFLDAV